MKHFLSIADLSAEDVEELFRLAAEWKRRTKAREARAPLVAHSQALVFEKPSLRTRVTFEVGMAQLGGASVYLAGPDIGLGKRESIADVARNLGRWVDVIVARTFSQSTVDELARHAGIPVVNALSDREHPCQALADFFTLWERGLDLRRIRLCWVGDGNNVCHSLMLLAARVGTEMTIAVPPGYEPDRTRAGDRPRRGAGESRSPAMCPRRPGAPTRSTPTCGSAWGRRASGRRVSRRSPGTR